MRYSLILTIFITIAFVPKSYAQQKQKTDSLTCFNEKEAREILLKLQLANVVEKELSVCEQWRKDLELKISILQPQVITLRSENEKLTTTLNDKDRKLKNARRGRIVWGISGVLIGALTYGIFVK